MQCKEVSFFSPNDTILTEVYLQPRHCVSGNVEQSVSDFMEDSVRTKICEVCSTTMQIQRKTVYQPQVLHLCYAVKADENCCRLPDVFPSFIDVEGQPYELQGAIYGNGSHFTSRFIRNNKIYLADGMRCRQGVYEALSVELNNDNEYCLPGEIKHSNESSKKRKFTPHDRAGDVFYLKV